MALAATELEAERSDLLAMLAQHRQFLRHTARDLTDEQARQRTTASELADRLLANPVIEQSTLEIREI